jgi:signal transduction histidine kinase/transcriptional regulator with GAF, ATPase, and Fis domain
MSRSNLNQPNREQPEKLILALKEVILAVTGSLDLDTLLQRILESCINFSNSSRGSLFLYDDESQELVMRAEMNNAPHLRFNAKYKVSGNKKIGLTASVFNEGRALALNTREDIIKHPDHLGKYNKDDVTGQIDCQSLICIPLKKDGMRSIGVLKIENTLDQEIHQTFSEKDIEDFQLLADIACEAIINFKTQAAKINTSINKIISNSLESNNSENLNERLYKIAATFKEISNAVGVSIWLREGTRLVCKAAVGKNYEDLAQRSYDIPIGSINEKERIGLTPWIAYSGNSINMKTNQEITSHHQYKGTYDEVLYPHGDGKCESFIGVPLKIGNRIIGVIKADSRVPDEQHRESHFTTEEVQIFSYLSIITSIIVESKQEFEKTDNHNRQLISLYKIGTECYELESSNAIFWYLLVALTHDEGIGFNRTTLFKFTEEKNKSYLTGLIGLGPIDKEEGTSIHKRFDAGDKLTLDECKSLFFEKNHPPFSELQKLIENNEILLSLKCDLHDFALLTLREKRSQVKLISMNKCSKAVQTLMDRLQTLNRNFLAFSLLDAEGQIFVGICDNIYSERAPYDSFSISATNTFTAQVSLALSRLSLKKSKEETTEEAWREFTAITAHRIGTETAIMSGALNFLKKSLVKHLKDDVWKEDLAVLEGSLTSLKKAVREHTELQKPPEVKCQKININQILNTVKEDVERLQSNLRQRVRIIKNYPDDLPVIQGDLDGLLYVFKELYENAIKAMPNGGELSINASIIGEREFLQIRISDTGTGIETDIIDKIFNRGFKGRTGGTGLGLFIAKRNIELYGGKIDVQNNKSSGASFFVTIPIPKSTLNRIMIVEDTSIQLKFLVRSIREKYPEIGRIDTVKNEREAIELLYSSITKSTEEKFDFIVADVNLEEGGGSIYGGITLLEYIRDNNIQTKVIIITAHKGMTYRDSNGIKRGVLDKAEELGAFACISRNQTVNYLDDLNEILNKQ